jgi:hypothetical protein
MTCALCHVAFIPLIGAPSQLLPNRPDGEIANLLVIHASWQI